MVCFDNANPTNECLCSICLDSVNILDQCVYECGHIVHQNCARKWAVHQIENTTDNPKHMFQFKCPFLYLSCPCCRTNISVDLDEKDANPLDEKVYDFLEILTLETTPKVKLGEFTVAKEGPDSTVIDYDFSPISSFSVQFFS